MKNVKKGHKHPIICLDAGHYGKYNRSPVVPEYYESDMNWKLHNMLATELEKYGIEVRKTRTSQAKDLGLYARGKASKGCDLFLSIHSNAIGSIGSESTDRPVGIYLVPDDSTNIDEMSKELAVLLSEAVQEVMQTKEKAAQKMRLAGKDLDGDGLDNDNYYGVLHGAWQVGTAGVILEHSFHTNTRATKWLLVDANLAKMAKKEAEVLAAYFGMTKDDAKPAEPEVEKWYRVRKSWEDKDSQIGAYKTLANAKKACKEGYTVYDWNGQAVYSVEAKKDDAPGVDHAKEFDADVAGTYKVRANTGLNLRTGAGTSSTILEVMEPGAQVRCYGYHTRHWYLVVSPTGKTGFCSSNYLLRA